MLFEKERYLITMSKSKKSLNNEDELIPQVKNMPKIRKSSLAPHGMNLNEKTLFDTVLIETNTTAFNIVAPGTGAGEAFLRYKNPCLLAMGNKAKISKSTQAPKTSMGNRRMLPPLGQGITSLLSKKPLADLPDPPMALIESVKNREELERLSLNFNEDPVAYFSKRKDGRGHLFIYMKYAKTRDDPTFSPYELVKVPHCDIGKDYFTMSASGVTHVEPDGTTDHISLDIWAKEESIFKAIRKLKTFQNYMLWKPLRLWKYFIMERRYNEIADDVIDKPIFYNECFTSATVAVSMLLEKSDEIISNKLHCFYPARKYTMDEFRKLCESNLNSLKDEYSDFINEVTVLVSQLDTMLSDPEILQVRDNEFAEIRRKNPNIGQLIVLERKKDAERIRRTEQMSEEMNYLVNYLRMVDYMILESLRTSCFHAYKVAEMNCLQDLSAIFLVNIFFSDDGKVSFKPSVDDLKSEVHRQLSIVFKTIDTLPRLLRATSLRHILRNSKINIPVLFDDGPDFQNITSCSPLLEDVERNIIAVIDHSYKEAEVYSEIFVDFYPLYKLGQTWDVRNFVITSSGEPYKGTLSYSDRLSTDEDDEYLIHPERSPILDFDIMKQLIDQLHVEIKRVGTIKSGNTRGIIHIDSRNLKTILTPIPMRSLQDVEKMLKDLMVFKSELMNRVFRAYLLRLKVDPTTLEAFVDFCELHQKTVDLIPQMKYEIQFIDKLCSLIEDSGFEVVKNQLHQPFHVFKLEQAAAQQVRNAHSERFEFLLSQVIKAKERKLAKYKEKSVNNIPMSAVDINVDNFYKQTLILKAKVEKIKPTIEANIHFQDVLNMKTTDFPELAEIESNVEFSEKLYHVIRLWESLHSKTKDVPFIHLDMNGFIVDANSLQREIEKLRDQWKKPSPILSEITVDFQEFLPYLDQLSQLSFGRMQIRHWNQLFDECGQSDTYNPSVTIQQLLSYGILSSGDKIKQITINSQGESQLENEFRTLKEHWNEVEVPLKDQLPGFDEDLRLAPLYPLISEINDTAITLNSMMVNKFVHGILPSVLELAQNLDLIIQILDQWQKFELNWVVISNLMKKKDVIQILPNQSSRFDVIQEKWQGIVAHVLQDKRLFHVCSYPNLMTEFEENNKSFEVIFSSLTALIDKKRETIPRLYFLSNDEIIKLLSTNDFSVFTSEIVKTMMHISQLSFSSEKESETKVESEHAFSEININGLIGEDGDNLQFLNPTSCDAPIEEWVPQVYESMKDATKEAVAVSLSRYSSTSLEDWIMTVTSYIAFLTLQVSFTRGIEDCFSNLETSPKVFLAYQNNLKSKIQVLMNLMTTPLSSTELMKVSSILTNFISYFERAKMLHSRVQQNSSKQTWHDMLKFKYDTSTMDITIQFGDNTWSHDHEFWGRASSLMITPAIEHSLMNICQARVYDQIPLIFGPFGVGKTEIIRTFASYLGKFVYSAASFPSFANHLLRTVLTGAALSGSWILFSEIDQLNSSSLSFLFDSIRAINDSKTADGSACFLNGNLIVVNPSTRIFLTSSLDKYTHSVIPPQLKVYVRPISISAPLVKKIVETKLLSNGYKSSKEISEHLDSFVSAMVPMFKLSDSRLQHCLKIINSDQDLIRQLMHSNKVEFVNYYEDPKTTEQFSIARSAFEHFRSMIDDSKINLLIDLLYMHFPLFDSFEKFKQYISNNFNFYIDKATQIIKQVIIEASTTMDVDFPIEYLTEKVINLFQLMRTSPCIIIFGPCNSGKTILIDLLSKAYRKMVQDADIVNHFKGIMPMKIRTVYQNSDTWENIFGSADEDPTQGTVWRYGQFQTALTNLNFYQNSHHRILKFDGKMSSKFTKFLFQFVSEGSCFRINSLGSFAADSTFHCFVETDDISNLTPEILSVCGLLSMSNLQIEKGQLNIMKIPKLRYPNFIFSIIKNKFKDHFSDEDFQILSTIFNEVSPRIIEKVVTLPTLVDFKFLADKYAKKAGIYGLQYITNKHINVVENPDHCKFLILKGFYDIFSSILEQDQIKDFDSWICEEFELPIPENWSGLNVSEQFIEAFPEPTLGSLTIEENKISPIDFSLLSSRAIVHIEDGGAMPLFINDFVIPNANFLQPVIVFNASMETRSNILLFGPSFSGKSSLLSFVFHNNKDVCPIEISLNKLITTGDIIEVIKTQTSLMRKLKINIEPPKLYALVFTHIDQASYHVIEFIRELMATSTLNLTSRIDPKLIDCFPLSNYFIVIKANKISNLPNNFITHFTPIQLFEYPKSTKLYICKKSMNAFGINSDLIHIMNEIIDLLQVSLSNILNIIMSISHIPERAAASEDDKIIVLRLLLSDVYFMCFNCDIEKFREFLQKAKPKFAEMNFGNAQDTFINEKILSAINYQWTNKIGKFNTRIVNLNDESMTKKMMDIMKSNVSSLTISNFVQLSISLLRPGHNCVISSITGSARISLCKLFASIFSFTFVDLTEVPNMMISIKTGIKSAIVENKSQLFILRVNENNIQDYDVLCSIFGDHNMIHAFSTEELDELILKFSALDKIDNNSRREWMQKIQFVMKCRCRLVIAKDCNIEQSQEIFDDVKIIAPTRESICENFISSQNLRNVFSNILTRIDDMLPIHHLNLFYDFVNSYQSYYDRNTFEPIYDIKTALDFISRISTERGVFIESLEAMKPDLNALQKEHDNKKKEIDEIMSKFNETRAKLNDEKEFKEKDLLDKKEELKHAQEDFANTKPLMNVAQKEIDNLTDNDVQPLKLTQGMTVPAVKIMLEIICITRDGDKKIADSLLNDPSLLNYIKGIKPLNINQEMLDQIKPYLNEEDFQRKNIETVAPIVMVFYQFIHALVLFATQNLHMKSVEQEVEAREEALKVFLESMKEEIKIVENAEKENEAIINEYKEISNKLAKMEGSFALIQGQKDKIDSILKDTEQLIKSWNEFYDKSKACTDIKCGDSILYSFYLSYCGICDIDTRKEMLNIANDEIMKANIATSFRNPYESIAAKLTSKLTVTIANSDLPHCILLDIEHAFNTPQPPLLIDPDNIIIEAFLNANKAYVVSINSSDFEAALAESMKEGKTLFIMDVDNLHQNVSLVLRLFKKTGEICLNGLKFSKHNNFRPIFLSNFSEPERLPNELITRTTIISSHSSCMNYVNSSIMKSFISHFEPRRVTNLLDIYSAETSKYLSIINLEIEILKNLNKMAVNRQNDEKYSYLDDIKTLDALIEVKNNYINTKKQIINAENAKKEIEESIEPLKPIISLCSTIWLCLSRYMPKVQPHYRFQFHHFIQTIHTTLHGFTSIRTSKITDSQKKEIRKVLLDSILQWLYPAFTLRDVIFFMFLTAFLSQQQSFDDLSLIISNLSEKLCLKYSTEKREIGLENIIDLLKTANASDFFDLTLTYVLQFFGDDIIQNYPVFQVENVFGPTPATPTMLISNDFHDISGLIISFVISRARLNNFVSYSLCDDPKILKDALEGTTTAMNRGNWVLLHYWKSSRKAAEVLNQIMFLLHSTTLNSNFRLVVNVHSTDYISPLLFSKCKRMVIEPFPSVKQIMRTIYTNFGQNLRYDINAKLYKRIFYVISITLAHLQFRSFLKPVGFKLFCGSSLHAIKEILDYIKPILDGDISIRCLRDFVQDIAFGNQIIETQDRRCMRAIIATMFQQGILDDNYNFLESSSNENQFWIPPVDGSLSAYQTHIKNMPLFQTTDVILANRNTSMPFLKWRLSEYLSTPFLSILEDDEQDSNSSPNNAFNHINKDNDDGNEIAAVNSDEAEKYYIDTEAALPSIIESIEVVEMSPLQLFWLSEIDFLNHILIVIRNDLKTRNKAIKRELSEDKVPQKWKLLSGLPTMSNLKQFLLILGEKRKFFLDCIKEPFVKQINIRLIENLKGFFSAYIHEFANKKGYEANGITYELSLVDSAEVDECSLIIHGLSALNGQIEHNRMTTPQANDCEGFVAFPPMKFTLTNLNQRSSNTFICPLYKYIFVPGSIDPNSIYMFDGETQNYIMDICIPTERGDRWWLLNGTALYCHVPQTFL
ncbi:Dynein heavy chain family protein [Tritrichomonas foetus]|uniref:Dynein heavy chain family protein n=1 Tax=Tritrichomonas foetus TaxID=1144522 RepID=A0A1J4JIP9_9EUKA|nr:Dynein heavy chain family protein [Tritrichomonas foetus]|eukprot:OHS97076.1 Dynein heavy chain family protein [Tritrichomonas foetus]